MQPAVCTVPRSQPDFQIDGHLLDVRAEVFEDHGKLLVLLVLPTARDDPPSRLAKQPSPRDAQQGAGSQSREAV